MALHLSEQILAQVASDLSASSAEIFRSRAHNVQADDLPCMIVKMSGEIKETQLNTYQDWILRIEIMGMAQSTSVDLETVIAALRKECHLLMVDDRTLGGLAIDVMESDVSEIQIDGDGDKPIGKQIWVWEILYRRTEADPSV